MTGATPARRPPRIGDGRLHVVESRETARAPSSSRAPLPLKKASPLAFHAIWLVAVVLLVFGLCMMLSVSTAAALNSTSGNKFLYLSNQGVTTIIGIVAMLLVSRVNYRKLRGVSVALLVVAGLSLLVVHVPHLSRTAGGATRWIPLGPLTFQPSEFAKLPIVLAGAHFLSLDRFKPDRLQAFLAPYGLFAAAVCGLVLVEPDLGTAAIIALLLLGLFWIAGMNKRHWVPLTVGSVGLAGIFTLSSAYRRARFLSFLHPFSDPTGNSYQLVQALYGFARGGWLGVGPGQSVEKFGYLPKAQTDMILAVVGEEFGLLGTTFVIALFIVFALACWRLARQCADSFGRYLIAGCGMLVVLQAAVNIGGVIGALPLTGVPLPFISYGRNSLLVMLVAVGVILSVARSAPARALPSAGRGIESTARLNGRPGNRCAPAALSQGVAGATPAALVGGLPVPPPGQGRRRKPLRQRSCER